MQKKYKIIGETRGLHNFIGQKYDGRVRLAASICSLVGITLMLGWEFETAQKTLSGASELSADLGLTIALLLSAMVYTAMGGIKGNASANYFQNFGKFFILCIIFIFDMILIGLIPVERLLPNPQAIVNQIGLVALATNVIFSLCWQFVDMTTWQSAVSSARAQGREDNVRRSLRLSGWLVFLAPGVIGTLLGVGLSGIPSLESDDLMRTAVGAIPYYWVHLAFIALVAMAVLSTVDGLLLGVAYTLVVDTNDRRYYKLKEISDINLARAGSDPNITDRLELLSAKMLAQLRIATVTSLFVGAFGVPLIRSALDISLFDFVYIMIVFQLGLVGPVVFALWNLRIGSSTALFAIFLSIFVGFFFITASSFFSAGVSLKELAGTVTVLISFTVCYLDFFRRGKENV